MKNIILLGGSNSLIHIGLQKGLKDGIEKLGGGGLEFHNLALGGCDGLQKLYELTHPKNQELFKNAEAILIETNINEYDMFAKSGLCFQILARNFELLCKALANLNTKVIFLILPLEPSENTAKHIKIIDNFNREKIKQYNFNCIDMQRYYNEKGLNPFFVTTDCFHQLSSIMRITGEKIIANLHIFKKHLQTHFKMPHFLVKSPKELFNQNLSCKELKNSLLNEQIYKLDEKNVLKFQNSYSGYGILGIYICNFFEVKPYNIASFILKNTKQKIIKGIASNFYHLHTLEEFFIIDEESFLYFNKTNESLSEGSVWLHKNVEILNNISHIGLAHFFLVKPDENFYEKNIDLQSLETKENIDITYDFTYILPPFELYKELIEEYCQRMDSVKQKPLQEQITHLHTKINTLNKQNETLQNTLNTHHFKKEKLELENLEQELILKKLSKEILAKKLGKKLDFFMPKITLIEANSAKARMHNHLAYKLGSCMIRNSKSLLGYIKMPFLLIALTIAHKEYPKIQLPKLEDYPDYKEALKEKQSLTYKLGLAFMQANKAWYKGGYIQFYFEVRRLKKEFKASPS
ncbi:glycosyl transferase [Campylobacter jejuni]|uniref:glycosyl transferase n=2 Tax=Campylobacter jejuni TaxID=197 RepID=UPI0020C03DBA|nr:glycosyl transferase [Campylobacter jejuni]